VKYNVQDAQLALKVSEGTQFYVLFNHFFSQSATEFE